MNCRVFVIVRCDKIAVVRVLSHKQKRGRALASRHGMRCTVLHVGFHVCSSAADDTIRLCCHPTSLPTRLPPFFPIRPTSSHFVFLRPPPHPHPPHPPPAHLTSPHIIALASPLPSPSPSPSSHFHTYNWQVATTRIQIQHQGGKREMALRSVMLVPCCPCVAPTACMLVRQGRHHGAPLLAGRAALGPRASATHRQTTRNPPSDNRSDNSGDDDSSNNSGNSSNNSDNSSGQEKEAGAAWDPVLHRLLNPGNRLFHLNERWGQLISGNAAAVAPCPAATTGGVCPGTSTGSGDGDGAGAGSEGKDKGKGKGKDTNKGKGKVKGAATSSPCPPGVCHIAGTPRLVGCAGRARSQRPCCCWPRPQPARLGVAVCRRRLCLPRRLRRPR